jgi:carboxypeptidase PM20D1
MTVVIAGFLRLTAEGWMLGPDLIIIFFGDQETSMASIKARVNEYRHLADSEFVFNADGGGATIPETGDRPASFGMQTAENLYDLRYDRS